MYNLFYYYYFYLQLVQRSKITNKNQLPNKTNIRSHAKQIKAENLTH